MYIPVNERLNCLIGGIKITPEEIAFPVQAIPQVLDLVLENQWIILGGDVLTPELKYTYDSWYYLPDANISLTANVKQSVERCKRYISEYGKEMERAFCMLLPFQIRLLMGNGVVNSLSVVAHSTD